MIGTVKVVILGEGRVGKTSMLLKFVKNQFDDKQKSTNNASYLDKQIVNTRGQSVMLQLWDTAGQQLYNCITPLYYRDAQAAIIVFDITFKQSFQRVKKWMEELSQSAPAGISICVAANKSDLQSARQIDRSIAQSYCKANNIKLFQTSAKSGAGITQLMQWVGDSVKASKGGGSKVGRLTGNREEERKRKCC